MLRFSCGLVISVLLSVTVCIVLIEARPPLTGPLEEAFNRVTEALNDTAITFIKTLSPPNTTKKNEGNKTRTRILFRGDLLGDFTDSDIIFPDAYQVIFENTPKINSAPKCAKGKTYCEHLASYPYDQVKDLLQRKNFKNDLFGKDEPPDDRYSITNRNNGEFEAFVCTSIQKTVFPRVGKNKNNKWKYIINQEESDYIQGIRIEVCRKEGSACDLIGERVNGYITSCKQKYMLRRMLALSDNGEAVPDTFQLPSACCCSYRKDLSFLSRFGVEDVSGRTKTKTKTQHP